MNTILVGPSVVLVPYRFVSFSSRIPYQSIPLWDHEYLNGLTFGVFGLWTRKRRTYYLDTWIYYKGVNTYRYVLSYPFISICSSCGFNPSDHIIETDLCFHWHVLLVSVPVTFLNINIFSPISISISIYHPPRPSPDPSFPVLSPSPPNPSSDNETTKQLQTTDLPQMDGIPRTSRVDRE